MSEGRGGAGATHAGAEGRGSAGQLRGPVLLVMRDGELEARLRERFHAHELPVVVRGSGEEALDSLADRDYAGVVLDLILPDMDGRLLVSSIRELPGASRLPVVVIGGRASPRVELECLGRGADVFFQKPVDAAEVAGETVALATAGGPPEDRDGGEVDRVSRLPTRGDLRRRFEERGAGPAHLLFVELEGYARATEVSEWEAWQRTIRRLGEALDEAAGELGGDVALARWKGGDFLLLAEGESPEAVGRVAETARRRMEATGSRDDPDEEPPTLLVGVVEVAEGESVESAVERARSRVESDEPAELREPRVLVAEDDDTTAALLRHRLERDGFRVDRFEDGAEAYRAVREDPPDLVVLDVKMPGMDGLELLGRLREEERFDAMPVIVLTAMGGEDDLVRGFELGADDYMQKPFSPIELMARVRSLLRRRR